MSRKLKLSLWIVSGLLLLFAAAFWSLNYWLQTDDAARTLEQLLSEKLAARVEIETPMRIRLGPEFAVMVEGLRVMDGAAGTQPVMEAGNSQLSFDSKALLGRRLSIERLESQDLTIAWQSLQNLWRQVPGRSTGSEQRPLALQSLGHIRGQSIRIVDFAIPGVSVELQQAELWPPTDGLIALELEGVIYLAVNRSLNFTLRLQFSMPNGSAGWGSLIRVDQLSLSDGILGFGHSVNGSMQLQWLAHAILISNLELSIATGIHLTISEAQLELDEPNNWRAAISLRIAENVVDPALSMLCDASGNRDSARLINCHSTGNEGLFSGNLAGCRGTAGRWTVNAELTDLDLARLRASLDMLTGPSSGEPLTADSLGLLPFAGIIRIASLRDGDWLAENLVVSLPGDLSCQIGEYE